MVPLYSKIFALILNFQVIMFFIFKVYEHFSNFDIIMKKKFSQYDFRQNTVNSDSDMIMTFYTAHDYVQKYLYGILKLDQMVH